MTMSLYVGGESTCVKLPVIPYEKRPVPQLDEVDSEYEEPPDARYLVGESTPVEGGLFVYHPIRRDARTGFVSIKTEGKGSFEVEDRSYKWRDTFTRETSE
jgi:hypothetical protein